MPQPQRSRPHEAGRKTASTALTLTSPAFANGATIPRRYTADGEDISPHLTWNEGPSGTVSFALVCEDPDAPSGLFVHWLVWNIPADESRLRPDFPATAETAGIRQGENGFGNPGWGGPSPPPGKPHRYVFRLYALDTALDLPGGASRTELDRAIEGHVLAESILIGMYGR